MLRVPEIQKSIRISIRIIPRRFKQKREASASVIMPRFFRCEEANPLRLVPFTVNTNGGPNDEGVRSLISARALLQEGVLAYPERSPSEATGSLASPHSGPTQVSFLLKPDQTLKVSSQSL